VTDSRAGLPRDDATELPIGSLCSTTPFDVAAASLLGRSALLSEAPCESDDVSDHRRVPIDLAAYVERSRSGACFVCGIVKRDPAFPAHVVYEDERHIAFLPNWHVLLGYVLVAPRDHRVAVAGDFSKDEYLELQGLVHRVALALADQVPTERIYILSLGSQQGNSHVHWHVAALPPGVPYEEQQYAALMVETKGVLALSAEEQRALAERVRVAIARGS
jgi:histidine triad (HIT) family protein